MSEPRANRRFQVFALLATLGNIEVRLQIPSFSILAILADTRELLFNTPDS